MQDDTLWINLSLLRTMNIQRKPNKEKIKHVAQHL